MIAKWLWIAWLGALIAGLSFHLGGGQLRLNEERAAALLADAAKLERDAAGKQQIARACSSTRIAAKRAAERSGATGDIEAARDAIHAEKAAWAEVRDAWAAVANVLERAQPLVREAPAQVRWSVQLSLDRALLGAGKVGTAISSLDRLVAELSRAGASFESLADRARAELATAHYVAARGLRLSGRADDEWRRVSAVARQQFRYLAEKHAGSDGELATLAQRNLEVVLDLEQASLDDLEGSPSPCPPPDEGDLPCSGLACERNGQRNGPGSESPSSPPSPPTDDDLPGPGATDIEVEGGGW